MKAMRIFGVGLFVFGMTVLGARMSAAPLHLGFTYQGVLEDAGIPAEGIYDITFTPYDTAFAGVPLDEAVVVDNVTVAGGVFAVELEFPPQGITGEQVWLEIAVRPGDSVNPGDYTILAPRQKVSPVPYALYALASGTVRHGSGVLPVGSLNPVQSANLGRVNFGYGFSSPPAVTVTAVFDTSGPAPYIPQIGDIDEDGFDLHVINPTNGVLPSRTYAFNWIAAGNGSLLQSWYRDLDLDGYSDGERIDAYEQPAGYYAASALASTSGDCDDTDASINPGAIEIWYDGIDQDCDGRSDYDQDMDGYDAVAYGGTDCDDMDRWVHPGAMELCGNGKDDNCDGLGDTDCVDRDCSEEMVAAFEAAYDACRLAGGSHESCFVEALEVVEGSPCESAIITLFTCDPMIQLCLLFEGEDFYACLYANCPAEFERVFGVPEDADGDGYNLYQDCDDTNPDINPGAVEIWYDGIDQDCDGLNDFDQDRDGHDSDAWGGGDCNDTNASIFPGAFDECGDGIDQDCDGSDRACDDLDEDGYDETVDCDDFDPNVYPGAPEIPYDYIDQDCDGADLTDVDGDGFDAWQVGGEDCDDTNPDIHPGAIEVPYNGVDDDCDGIIDEGDVDYDGDGFPGYDDCDDTDATINPDAMEIWYDGIDQNCDGLIDYDQDYDGFEAEPWGNDCDDTRADINPGRPEIIGDGIDNDCDGEIDELF